MKILQVINTLKMGGAEKLISELVPRMKSYGFDVDVAVFDGSGTPFMEKLRNSGVNIISLNQNPGSPYSLVNFFKLLPVLKGYDIVHSHTTPAQMYCSLAKVFNPSMTMVTTEHSTYNHRRGKWYFRLLDKCVYSSYSKIICIGQSPRVNLEKQIGDQGDKIVVIENGIDVGQYNKVFAIGRDEINCKISDFILTMVGRFTDAKDQHTIVKALPLLPENVKLVLVGDGPLKERVSKFADELGVLDRMRFMGLRNDVPSILKTSDVVILSSHWEGFGLAAVEGMAAHKPVIASNVSGLREVVEGAGLLFEVGDAEELSRLIISLKDDATLYGKIASQCYERAKKYDIDLVAHRYEQVYKELINN